MSDKKAIKPSTTNKTNKQKLQCTKLMIAFNMQLLKDELADLIILHEPLIVRLDGKKLRLTQKVVQLRENLNYIS